MELAIKTSRRVVLTGLITSLFAALMALVYLQGMSAREIYGEDRIFAWEWYPHFFMQVLPFILAPLFFFAARKLKGGWLTGTAGIVSGIPLVFWMGHETNEVTYQLLYIAGFGGVLFGLSVLALQFLIPATLLLPSPISIWSIFGRRT